MELPAIEEFLMKLRLFLPGIQTIFNDILALYVTFNEWNLAV
jgi:hypothetical protein